MSGRSDPTPNPVERLQEASQLQHLLGNQLTVACGYAELLTMNPDLPPALLPQIQQVCQAATDATRTLQQLQQLTRALSVQFAQL
jgi:hypothetical protein